MTVMQYCTGPLFPHVLGAIALGFLLCLLLRLPAKKSLILFAVLFVIFRTFECVADWGYEGRIAGRWAVYLSLTAFGLCMGSAVYWGVLTLREKQKQENEENIP